MLRLNTSSGRMIASSLFRIEALFIHSFVLATGQAADVPLAGFEIQLAFVNIGMDCIFVFYPE